MGVGENKHTTSCLRKEEIPLPPFSILRLAQGVKGQGFNYRSIKPAEILVTSHVRIPKYSYLQALIVNMIQIHGK